MGHQGFMLDSSVHGRAVKPEHHVDPPAKRKSFMLSKNKETKQYSTIEKQFLKSFKDFSTQL